MNWAILIVLGTVAFWSLIDVVLNHVGGNDWTISWNLLGVEGGAPVFGPIMYYAMGVLLVHLFNPKLAVSPPFDEQIDRAFYAVAPAIIALILLIRHNESLPDSFETTVWWLAVCVASGLAGTVVGRCLVPQHLGN